LAALLQFSSDPDDNNETSLCLLPGRSVAAMLLFPSYHRRIACLLAGLLSCFLVTATWAADFVVNILPPVPFQKTDGTDTRSEPLFRIPSPEVSPPQATGDHPVSPFAGNAGREESLLDNFSLLLALDASREPQDLGINANFGGFIAANAGFAIIDEIGLGGQIGTGVNLSRAGVKVLRVIQGTRARQQWFSTAGLFHRDDGWHVGVVYDLQVESYYDRFFTGQLRGEAGVDLTAHDQMGVWGTAGGFGDGGKVLNSEVHVEPLAEISLYWQHCWQSGALTRFWTGVTESHHTDIIDMPDRHTTGPVINFGLEVFVPLNDYFAIFGQGHFITPSDTGTLDAYLGVVFYPGGGVSRVRSNAYAPVLPVANNPTFSLDLRR
jgi:hypothetical protein